MDNKQEPKPNMNNAVQERQRLLMEDFNRLPSWEDRYKKLIEMGKKIPPLPLEFQIDKFKVQGCQSQVWLHAEMKADGRVWFLADSDALIVKGLVAILLKTFSDASPDEILGASPGFIQKLGFEGHLSPSRANGLHSMVKQIYYYASVFQALAKAQNQ